MVAAIIKANIQNIELRLQLAKTEKEYWHNREKKEKEEPIFEGERSYNYMRFLKEKQKASKAEIEYLLEELKKEEIKLTFM